MQQSKLKCAFLLLCVMLLPLKKQNVTLLIVSGHQVHMRETQGQDASIDLEVVNMKGDIEKLRC